MAYSIEGVEGLPEIQQDDDLAELIAAAAELEDGDILVVTSKIVSKSEGRIVQADDREAAITAETVRVVATREHEGGVTRIVENRQGIIGAAAGVDASNAPHGTVLLLPVDPDASARALATGLRALTGRHVGVILSDTLGRPWREGQTDIAIGAAGAGDVIVVAAGGRRDIAVIGELLGGAARRKGILGVVVDGGVRDVATVRTWPDFHMFGRWITSRGPTTMERGTVNEPIVFGGVATLVLEPCSPG